jgi:YesN/AraC family two-component response regulator
MGFDDYIVKPVNIDELKKCLSKYIEKLLEN